MNRGWHYWFLKQEKTCTSMTAQQVQKLHHCNNFLFRHSLSASANIPYLSRIADVLFSWWSVSYCLSETWEGATTTVVFDGHCIASGCHQVFSHFSYWWGSKCSLSWPFALWQFIYPQPSGKGTRPQLFHWQCLLSHQVGRVVPFLQHITLDLYLTQLCALNSFNLPRLRLHHA